MAIPDYQDFMLPLLEAVADGDDHRMRDLTKCLGVLIDGRRLADLMIDHGIGVATARTYSVKKVDLDYFVEDEG